MVGYKNKLYGLLQNAGPSGNGIIFSYDPASGEFEPVYSFNGIHGALPYQITVYKDKFYGTAQYGGANANDGSAGTLFSFDPATGKYTDLHDNSDSYRGNQGFVIDTAPLPRPSPLTISPPKPTETPTLQGARRPAPNYWSHIAAATQRGNSVYAPISATKMLTVGKASLLIRADDTLNINTGLFRPSR